MSAPKAAKEGEYYLDYTRRGLTECPSSDFRNRLTPPLSLYHPLFSFSWLPPTLKFSRLSEFSHQHHCPSSPPALPCPCASPPPELSQHRWHFPNMAARHSLNTFSRFTLRHPRSRSFLSLPAFSPTSRSSPGLLGPKQRQKLAPELAEVIGIKLQ